MFNLTITAFDLADKYLNPVILLGDGALGQMMEPLCIDVGNIDLVDKPWATTGMGARTKPNRVNTLHLRPEELEGHNNKLQDKYNIVKDQEVRFEESFTHDAELVLVAYGITSRIAYSAMEMARAEGLKVGLFRPITLWPFPEKDLFRCARAACAVLTLELSAGQMVEDVRLAVNGSKPVHFYGRTGGILMTPREVLEKIREILLAKGGK